MKTIRMLLAALFATGALAIGATSALAGTQATVMSFSIPVTITYTGLAATYNGGTQAAGSTFAFPDQGPQTLSTNGTLGAHITVVAAAANFVGVTPANTIPIANDTISVVACPSGATCSSFPLMVSGQTLLNTTVAGTWSFSSHQSLVVPAAQLPDSYSLTINFVANAN
jgi:hypothetical protein